MALKICVVSEALRKPFDEGVKLFVFNLIKELSKEHIVLGLSRYSEFEDDIREIVFQALPRNKLFISQYLKKKIRVFEPEIIIYLPTAHATLFSFLRTKILKYYGKKSKTVMVTMQPREYSRLSRRIVPMFLPDLVLAQSDKTFQVMKSFGCKTKKIVCGVDLKKFIPVDRTKKEDLRKKYGFSNDEFIALHVGHINRNRNAQYMEKIQSIEGVQAVIVGSKSYPEDTQLVKELREKGVRVFNDYLRDIQEIYQFADCYVFPVVSEGACIETPLSIFEALACNLPVITTRFGGVPASIPEQAGFTYVDDIEEILSKITLQKHSSCIGTRHIAERFSWETVTKQVIMAARTEC